MAKSGELDGDMTAGDDVKDKEQLLNALHDANKRQVAEEAAKKRDNTVHNEQVNAIKEEIKDILTQLEELGGV